MLYTEPLTGGLVKSRAPGSLSKGELVRAQNGIYLPDDDAINRAPGFAAWSTIASASDVTGLVGLRFDGSVSYLLAQTSTHYWLADAETDNTSFSSALAISSGERINAVRFDNRYYIFNGVNENQVLRSNGTLRDHGLLPVVDVPPITTVASSFSLPTTGTYEYWYTEVRRDVEDDELESAYSAKGATIANNSTATAPRLSLPASPRNPLATHYRIYRSDSIKTNAFDELFPNGYAVTDLPVGTTYFIDGGTASSASANPSGSTALNTGWATIPGMYAAGGTTAVHTYSTATQNRTPVYAALYTFGLTAPAGNITGIEVIVNARASDPTRSKISVGVGNYVRANTNAPFELLSNTAAYPSGYNIPATQKDLGLLTAGFANYTVGSSTDDWLPVDYSFSADKANSSSFAVVIAGQFGSIQTSSGTKTWPAHGSTIEVDSVTLRVYYNGPLSTDFGVAYPSIDLELGGQTVSFSTREKAPIASMGCIFEGCLVTDSPASPGTAFYSVPGEPDAYSLGGYFLDLETEEPLSHMSVLNGKMLNATQTKLVRVNYLPSEQDASINRGRAWDPITESKGILHSRAACKFVGQDGRELLAFVSPNGIFATDGFNVTNIGGDLRWLGPEGLVVALSEAVKAQVISLTNDPGTQTLRLLMSGGLEYNGSYADRHRKPGLKWAGPVRIRLGSTTRYPKSSTVIARANGAFIPVYGMSSGTSGGSVWRQDAADTIYTFANVLPETSNNQLIVQTRDMYLAGRGQQFKTNSVALYGRDRSTASNASNAPDATIVATQLYTNAATESHTLEATQTGIASRLTERPVDNLNADAVSFLITQTSTNPFELEEVILDVEGTGEATIRA